MFALANTTFNRFTRNKANRANLATGRNPKVLTRVAITFLGITALAGAAFADSGTIAVAPSTLALTGGAGAYASTSPGYTITCDADSSNNNGKGTVTVSGGYTTTGPETSVTLGLVVGAGFTSTLASTASVAIAHAGTTPLFNMVPVHSDTTAASIGTATVSVVAPLTATPGSYTGTITFTMSETGATANMTTITTTATYTYTIAPPTLTGFTLTSSQISASSTTGMVTLSSEAPVGGTAVTLTSQWPAYVAINGSNVSPTTVTVPAGSTSTTFPISTPQLWSGTFTDQITASLASASFPQTLTVYSYALQSIAVNPTTVQAGGSATGTITLAGNAPAGGWTVNLSMNNSTFVTVPATVVVSSGSNTATFPVTTSTKAPTSGWLINGYDGAIYKDAAFNTTNDSIQSVVASQSTIGSGGSSMVTVTLNSPAPAGGWTMNVTVGAAGYLSGVPSTLTIGAGDTTGGFNVTGKAVGTTVGPINIIVSDAGSSGNAPITLAGDVVQSVTLGSSSIKGGTSTTGTVTLSTAAPTGGWLVNLSSGAPSIASTSVGFVVVAAGQTTANFTVNTGVVDTTVGPIGIYGSDGNSGAVGYLTVTP